MSARQEMAEFERTSFSLRLKTILLSKGLSESPTKLQRMFNNWCPGGKITVHAARKWLLGEAIPTQEKLRMLAEMLSVNESQLRYGTGPSSTGTNSPDTLILAKFVERLSLRSRRMVRQLAEHLDNLESAAERNGRDS